MGATGTARDERRRPSVVRRAVAQFALTGAVAVAIVAVATSAASRRVGEREAVADARTTTIVKAQRLVEPLVTDAFAAGDATARSRIGEVVERRVLDPSLVRVKIWSADGTILYSDATALVGERFRLGDDEVGALRSGSVDAEVSDLAKPENRLERHFGKLLEVYLPVRTPSGARLLFEAYFRYDAVAASGSRIWRSFAPFTIGALVVLELLQIPLAWSLAARLRNRQRERETLLEHAIDASDLERRRIAADLHDGVVQDLVGLSLNLAGTARDPGMPAQARELLEGTASAVRANISALRTLLVDIYPPDLGDRGLRPALADVAEEATTGDLTVDLVAPDLPPLPEPVAKVLYRAAREALRNVVRHAQAAHATIDAGVGAAGAWLQVDDDGIGFDAAAAPGDGHFGLRSLRDMARDAGGDLSVGPRPGGGTTMRVEVPLR